MLHNSHKLWEYYEQKYEDICASAPIIYLEGQTTHALEVLITCAQCTGQYRVCADGGVMQFRKQSPVPCPYCKSHMVAQAAQHSGSCFNAVLYPDQTLTSQEKK